ncbi:M23 family peptidase, partial [Rhodococcus sp. WS4]
MHHRSQFTASRFVSHHGDELRGHKDEVTPTYPSRSVERHSETDSSEISSMLFRNSQAPHDSVDAGQAAVTNGSSGSSDHSEVALASDESSAIGTTAEPQAAQFSTVADTAASDSNA